MDSNGYNESIIQQNGECFICWRKGQMVRHEAFHGPFRKKAKKLGCWVEVCPACHWAIHNTDGSLDRSVKQRVQKEAMIHYGWKTEEFIREFGKNYLEEKI